MHFEPPFASQAAQPSVVRGLWQRYANAATADRRRFYHQGVRPVTPDELLCDARRYNGDEPVGAPAAIDVEGIDVDPGMKSPRISPKVYCWRGDITCLEVDAVVVSACHDLKPNSPDTVALFDMAGSALRKECQAIGSLDSGCTVTCGYDLPARFIIHVAYPIDPTAQESARCYQQIFHAVEACKLKSVAFSSFALNPLNSGPETHHCVCEAWKWLERTSHNLDLLIFVGQHKKVISYWHHWLNIYFPLPEGLQHVASPEQPRTLLSQTTSTSSPRSWQNTCPLVPINTLAPRIPTTTNSPILTSELITFTPKPPSPLSPAANSAHQISVPSPNSSAPTPEHASVSEFLTSLGCESYMSIFVKEEITTMDRLLTLSTEDLREMGLKMGSRNLIANSIQKIKDLQSTSSSVTNKFLADIVPHEYIGGGHYGEVYRGMWHSTAVAMKKILTQTNTSASSSALAEATLLSKLAHPHIVMYYGMTLYNGVLYIVTELEEGSVDNLLRIEGAKLSVEQLTTMARHAAEGMAYLASVKIVHRDLRCANLLVQDGFHVLVSDFGLSRILANDCYYSTNHTIPYKWTSIEALQYSRYTAHSDIWSFGVLLWELFSYGKTPYPAVDNQNVLSLLETGYRLPPPENCPDFVANVMAECWNSNPAMRPSFADICVKLEPPQTPSGPSSECMGGAVQPELFVYNNNNSYS
ncbi:protein tyrosine kinase 6 [Pelomyxa schiedti]|nr:protein tyrosine kinase 6 [Pelomyxa schiedti]